MSSAKFYTNVALNRGDILLRGYEHGRRVQRRIKYKPYLFVPDAKKGDYRSLVGNNPMSKIDFDSVNDAKEFMDKYSDVSNFEYHGLTRWQYLFINDYYPGLVDFDVGVVRTAFLDIECGSEGGFPNIKLADQPLTAITISDGTKYWTLSYFDGFMNNDPDVEYIQCKNERELIFKFLDIYREIDPDVITGWNVEGFDLPYLHTRITNLIDKETADKLSPWGYSYRRKGFDRMGRENEYVSLLGVATLDYLQLYLKFTYTKQESYTLGYIAQAELGDDKVDYKSLGYKNLDDLYKRNPQLYIEYNIHDVRLVKKLDDKMKFLDQAMAIAFDAKINFEDCTTSVLLWDIIIHNDLMSKKICIPRQKEGRKDDAIAGAYVKDPRTGLYKWIVAFDLASLYPHLIQQFNISPETYLGKQKNSYIHPDVVLNDKDWEPHRLFAIENNVAIAGNGAAFRRDSQGVLPELMNRYYNDRKKYKTMMIAAQKELVEIETEIKRRALLNK